MDYQQMTLFGEQGAKPLRLYQGDSPVNRIALQESAKHLVMSVIYGPKCGASLAKLSRDGLWLKTCQGYFQAKMDGSLQEFSEILPRWGLMWDGELQALLQLEPYIDENGLRLLPTPTASDYRGGAHTTSRKESRTDREQQLQGFLQTSFRADISGCNANGKHYGISHRVDRVKALGNAVVPQSFYPFFKAIYDIESEDDK